jgi:hypothetical protein
MAYYLVTAEPMQLEDLRRRLDSGEIAALRPFGTSMHASLLGARRTPDGRAIWEEECYCSPPLKQERQVLDQYFRGLTTEQVDRGSGWAQIDDLPSLWQTGEESL